MAKKNPFAAKDKLIEAKMSPAMKKKDDAFDRKNKVKESSKKDVKLDTKMLKGKK